MVFAFGRLGLTGIQISSTYHKAAETPWRKLRLEPYSVHYERSMFSTSLLSHLFVILWLPSIQPMSKAVIENFCQLHESGILYRANRLVNWCVQLNTTLSNLEVSFYFRQHSTVYSDLLRKQ